MFKFKKLVSLGVAVIMTLSLGTTAFATDTIPNTEHYMENNNINPTKMTNDELELYNQLIDEQVNEITNEYGGNIDKMWLRQEIIKSLEGGYIVQSEQSSNRMTRAGSIIPDINISNKIVAAGINVAIGVAIGGSVAGLSAFIKKAGVREARKIFTRTLTTRLKAWGLKSLSKVVPTAVGFAFTLLDPGTAIAEYLDSKDHKPNNGQLNYIL